MEKFKLEEGCYTIYPSNKEFISLIKDDKIDEELLFAFIPEKNKSSIGKDYKITYIVGKEYATNSSGAIIYLTW